MQTLSVQIMTAWLVARQRLRDAYDTVRDDRGELTGNVILLAALAVAAAAVGAIIVARINSNAEKIPGG
ncbi:MAG: hypothetical protein ACK5OX_14505 [Desertimonas sp.]